MAGTLRACLFFFLSSSKSDGLFQSFISLSPCELKAAKPAFEPLGQLVYLLLMQANEANNGVIGMPPEAASGAILYQKAVLVTLQHRYYFSTRALRSLRESAVLSPLHHCLLYPRTVFRIDAPKQTAGPQRLCSLRDI